MHVLDGTFGPSGTSPRSAALAWSTAAWSATWLVTIVSRTVLRRSLVACGDLYGLYLVGLLTMPASIAACGNVNFSAVVPKYARAAASTPYTFPVNSTMLR